MALPQYIVQNVGGTLTLDAPVRAGAAPTVTVRNRSGGAIVGPVAATLDAVNTTISSAAAVGDWTLAVASIANILSGRQYRLGPANPASSAAEPWEFVQVLSATGTTLTLARPVRHAHASGVALAGARLSYTVLGTASTALFFGGHAEWDLDTTAAEQNIRIEVECTRVPHVNLCTIEDVAAIHPQVLALLDREVDVPQALARAYERVMQQLGASYRVRTHIGSDGFVELTALRFLFDIARYRGDEVGMKRWGDELQAAMDEIKSERATDNDQDGAVEFHEGAFDTGRVDRA